MVQEQVGLSEEPEGAAGAAEAAEPEGISAEQEEVQPEQAAKQAQAVLSYQTAQIVLRQINVRAAFAQTECAVKQPVILRVWPAHQG